jgi:hypothetical protein
MAKATKPKRNNSKHDKTSKNRDAKSRPPQVAYKQGPPVVRTTSALVGRFGGLICLALVKLHLTVTIGGLYVALDLVSRYR